jgi:protein-S-isoprenylcysteine O-methyltransferase Ste14
VVQGVVLFGAAGTLRYEQAWSYLAVSFVGSAVTNVYLQRKDRELLRRRLTIEEEGETERVHRVFFALVRLLALALFVVAGLDRRFAWSNVPGSVVAGATLGVAAGLLVIFEVFRANSHASSVIEVGEGQKVVTSGPYRSVRHPMYTGALLGMVATPLALGSYWAEAAFPPLLAVFVVRLLAEERFLANRLPGYAEYLARTPKRLVPGVW